MKTGRIFWGVFFVALGAAFLLQRFEVLNLQWHHAWLYWPLVLIAWGAAILFGGKTVKLIAVVVAAVVLALVLVAVLSFSWFGDFSDEGTITQDRTFHEAFVPGATRASFQLNSGAGNFIIRDTTADMVEVSTTTNLGTYSLDRMGEDSSAEYVLDLNRARKGWHPGHVTNKAEVRLNATPVWDITMDVGAAKLRCDLSAYKVANVKLDCGAASVDLRLGKGVSESTVDIDAGASSLNIEVPSDVGCEIRIDAPLSGKSIDGFTRIEKGFYKSLNYDSAVEHCAITIDAGVSSIRIERY
jgi:hypothetical protein